MVLCNHNSRNLGKTFYLTRKVYSIFGVQL